MKEGLGPQHCNQTHRADGFPENAGRAQKWHQMISMPKGNAIAIAKRQRSDNESDSESKSERGGDRGIIATAKQ